MQYYGLDQKNNPVLASEAERGLSYLCPECKEILRARGGPHRQIHFYHLRPTTACAQHKKTLAHLQTQWHLLSRLPRDEGAMERPFPEIGRIADVAWDKKKIVFEVQCSPITAEEVEGRCRDYASLGWRVVWIFHDNRFNKRKLSGAEATARDRGGYFTNMSDEGKGFIYDQSDRVKGNRRLFHGAPLPIAVEEPIFAGGALYFRGDLRDRRGGAPLEKEVPKPFKLWERIKRGYNAILYFALEESCD